MTFDPAKTDDFRIWMPDSVDLVKGASEESRKIGGYASTQHKDRQDEVALQKGLDFDEFVNHGWFNDNHSQATSAVVGVPEMAAYHPEQGWYTEGHLIKGTQRADAIWELAKSLKPTRRRLGFSIEGKVLARRDNMIVKAKIRNVAITNCPVNTACTWDIISKSMHPDLVDPQYTPEGEFSWLKALSVGHDRPATQGGRVLTPDDLEGGYSEHIFACPSCEETYASGAALDQHLSTAHKKGGGRKHVRKSSTLTVTEAAMMIHRIRPHLSLSTCERIARFAASR